MPKRLWRSFRARLLVGSLMWTAGLLYVTHMLTVLLVMGHEAFQGRFGPNLSGLLVAVALMTVGVLIVHSGLKSFEALRRQLGDVHKGRERRVSGEYLSEVQPLVDDLNALLEHHDRRVKEAVAKAGDLAHGLKTPLAVLNHDADRLAAGGHHDLAATLRQQIDRMRRHVDYHLAHARAAASGATPGARSVIADSVAAIVRTMDRLHASRALSVTFDVPRDHIARVERQDLDEILGNLVDNACKWTRRQVAVSSTACHDLIVVTVDDDGAGIPETMRDAVMQRGVRLDEAAPGSGFGLAIVRDLVEIYGGSLALEQSPIGGARAVVRLPSAAFSGRSARPD
jgi:signal transduction histidine kinase